MNEQTYISPGTGHFIDGLVDDLEPVRPVRPGVGIGLALAITAGAAIVIGAVFGVRADVAAGAPDEMFILRSGVLLLLGVATALAAGNMARPGVGRYSRGWLWALATAGLFPATAALMSAIDPPSMNDLRLEHGLQCLAVSLSAALAIGSGLTLWLRRGAPTSPERAGWLVGIASGALAGAAWNIYCPFSDILYTGLWFGLAVAGAAALGRLIVPGIVRW